MNQSAAIRVLITDDNGPVREGIQLLLTRAKMEVVAQATDGVEAVALFRQYRPDVTLMDLRMPRMDGLTAIRTIVGEFPEARIVVLTSMEGEDQRCFDAGARAVLMKDAPKGEILATIEAAYNN